MRFKNVIQSYKIITIRTPSLYKHIKLHTLTLRVRRGKNPSTRKYSHKKLTNKFTHCRAYTHTHMQACTYIHAHVHTYIHTHTCLEFTLHSSDAMIIILFVHPPLLHILNNRQQCKDFFFLKTATKQVSTFAKHSFIIRNKLFCIKISMR